MTALARNWFRIPVRKILSGAVVIAAIGVSCQPQQPRSLALRFRPFVGDQALQLGRVRYANPGGEGAFEVRDFQFFVSNIRLVSDSAEFVEPESYHLARFDGDDGTYVILLEGIPPGDYRRVELGLGVDPEANGTLASIGELDPNGRMAWSWQDGYKFVLVEGKLLVGDAETPLVYHVGFDESYRPVSLELPEALFAGPEAEVEICADLLQMFSARTTVDMSALSNVKFDRADAKLLADNYASMLSLCSARQVASP